MRWSPLVSLFAVLAVTSIIEGVFAAPVDVILEGRARVRSAPSKKLTAGSLKKSSSTYRKAALLGSTYTKSSRKIAKIRTPKAPPKGKDAGRQYNQPCLSRTDGHIFRPYPWGPDGCQGVEKGWPHDDRVRWLWDLYRVALIVTAL